MITGIATHTLLLIGAYLWGSLPLGYWLLRERRGIDVRRYAPHNVGAGTLVAMAGPSLVAAVAADLAKGLLPVLVAHALWASPWAGPVAAAGAVLGHAYSVYFFATERHFPRAMSVTPAAGTLLALWWIGALSTVAAAAAAAAATLAGAAALVVPRLFGRGWGYLSLATVLGGLALLATLVAVGANDPALAFGVLLASLMLWRHKEHLARILDSVEPRLGERLPITGLDDEVACAFMIHPLTINGWWESRRFAWMRPLVERGIIPERFLLWLGRMARPMKVDEIRPVVTRDGHRARVYLIGTPMLPTQIKSHQKLATRRAIQAARLARDLGATVLGLGAYWSVVGRKGEDVQARSEIAITNGGGYTAGTIRVAVPQIIRRLEQRGVDPRRATAAVVGANGVVGFGICRMIADKVGTIVMVGTNPERLERSRELLARRYPGVTLEITTDAADARRADLIFTATSQGEPVIFPAHVRPGCLIYDLGRPPDVHPSVAEVPGVEVVPGGMIRLPGGAQWRVDLTLGHGLVPACLAEVLIIAIDGAHQRCSLGDGTRSEDIEYFVRRGEEMGFEVVTGLGPDGAPADLTPRAPTAAAAAGGPPLAGRGNPDRAT
ncbi:MAG: glycerol-3-phosphate acyltransferase [Armatimonadetes bacterium]|nr:glycerol-3-phosphate acyltransferase [Armatimonadota bacterium]